MIDIKSLKVDDNLIEKTRKVIQENINAYAESSRDFNPIHIDPAFAAGTAAGGTIAHGMLILAYCSQMMTENFGKYWVESGKFNIRFKMPARPDDMLKIRGKVNRIQDEESTRLISCEILCSNQKDEVIISGEAKVRVEND
jgi:3-hydroxybutyryl-CoA dehydratase